MQNLGASRRPSSSIEHPSDEPTRGFGGYLCWSARSGVESISVAPLLTHKRKVLGYLIVLFKSLIHQNVRSAAI
jgi:hypothetical protein